jgi:hypothetical protein
MSAKTILVALGAVSTLATVSVPSDASAQAALLGAAIVAPLAFMAGAAIASPPYYAAPPYGYGYGYYPPPGYVAPPPPPPYAYPGPGPGYGYGPCWPDAYGQRICAGQ